MTSYNFYILATLTCALLFITSVSCTRHTLNPFKSPCKPEDDCRFEDTYPCNWTDTTCKYSSKTAMFFCYDVPGTASFSYTVTPQNTPVSASPSVSYTLWGDNATSVHECTKNVLVLNRAWKSLSKSEKQTLPVEVQHPINIDDLDLNDGALDFSNGVHEWPSTVLNNMDLPYTGVAGYVSIVKRESRDNIKTECMDVSFDISFT